LIGLVGNIIEDLQVLICSVFCKLGRIVASLACWIALVVCIESGKIAHHLNGFADLTLLQNASIATRDSTLATDIL
jgi:hypothetical protein